MAYLIDKAFDLIQAAHSRKRLAHAILIHGPRNCGKEQLISRIIQCVNPSPDAATFDLFGNPVTTPDRSLAELESSWVSILRPQKVSRRIGVDEIRAFEAKLYFNAPEGTWKIGVIIDAERMTEQASNAFLKTLEEPPASTLLILATTIPELMLRTIRSRCLILPILAQPNLHENGGKNMADQLTKIASTRFGTALGAMQMKAVLDDCFLSFELEIEKSTKLLIKEEASHYRDATDGSWLKDREDFYKALSKSNLLQHRSFVLDVLFAWLMDMIYIKLDVHELTFPDCKEALMQVCQNEPLDHLLRRIDAIDQLRQALNTNVSESFALEVGLLNAFGAL